MKHLIFAGAIALASTAQADQVMVRGGILCDTKHELEVLLTGISLNNGQFPSEMPNGCGNFVPRQPVPFTVEPVEVYELPLADVYIAKFTYEPNGWVQYGWIDWKPNTPVEQDEKA